MEGGGSTAKGCGHSRDPSLPPGLPPGLSLTWHARDEGRSRQRPRTEVEVRVEFGRHHPLHVMIGVSAVR